MDVGVIVVVRLSWESHVVVVMAVGGVVALSPTVPRLEVVYVRPILGKRQRYTSETSSDGSDATIDEGTKDGRHVKFVLAQNRYHYFDKISNRKWKQIEAEQRKVQESLAKEPAAGDAQNSTDENTKPAASTNTQRGESTTLCRGRAHDHGTGGNKLKNSKVCSLPENTSDDGDSKKNGKAKTGKRSGKATPGVKPKKKRKRKTLRK